MAPEFSLVATGLAEELTPTSNGQRSWNPTRSGAFSQVSKRECMLFGGSRPPLLDPLTFHGYTASLCFHVGTG
jgi:hypothetical protein